MREHYEGRIGHARASDDFAGWMDEIMKDFIRDLSTGIVTERESRGLARMLNEASCEAAKLEKAS